MLKRLCKSRQRKQSSPNTDFFVRFRAKYKKEFTGQKEVIDKLLNIVEIMPRVQCNWNPYGHIKPIVRISHNWAEVCVDGILVDGWVESCKNRSGRNIPERNKIMELKQNDLRQIAHLIFRVGVSNENSLFPSMIEWEDCGTADGKSRQQVRLSHAPQPKNELSVVVWWWVYIVITIFVSW